MMFSMSFRMGFRGLLVLAIVGGYLLSPAMETEAEAFCGFYVSGSNENLYNDATQVVMMRDGKRTILSMSNHYDGPAEDFAMVVPVPVVLKKKNVKTLSHKIFKKVEQMDSPRLVEYWERDPCSTKSYGGLGAAVGMRGGMGYGSGKGTGAPSRVQIKAQFKVGEYEIVILSADDSMALDTWLRAEKYNIPAGAEAAMQPYIDAGMFFFVAKVDLEKVKRDKEGRALLSPLRFSYESEAFSLPIRLGLLNAKGAQDLIVHILARGQRYEVANLPNITIPTNIELHESAKANFGEFYAALFDAAQAKSPGAVVTEYSWDASTCDPCPGPNLSGRDFLTLGADELPGQPQRGFTLTRLHARYQAEDLKEDFIFKAASPIAGGREVHSDKGLEKGASPAGTNNFQGRYIIRHPWTGPIECASPRRGTWGGPQGKGASFTSGTQDTAFAPRGAFSLPEAVAEDVPEIGIKAKKKRRKQKR